MQQDCVLGRLEIIVYRGTRSACVFTAVITEEIVSQPNYSDPARPNHDHRQAIPSAAAAWQPVSRLYTGGQLKLNTANWYEHFSSLYFTDSLWNSIIFRVPFS